MNQKPRRATPGLEVGVNDFATIHPDLAAQWHPTKNGPVRPCDVLPKSSFIAWWVHPECGHEWESTIQTRVIGPTCPYCNNKRVLTGFNDLATVSLDLAVQWHPTKNGELTAQTVVANSSSKKRWWLHPECGHEWEATIHNRLKGGGCPFCATKGKRVDPGVTDLATTHPEVAADWHPTKNGTKTARDFLGASNKLAWWKGAECGHEWEAKISARAVRGARCPACLNRKIIPGLNDLASQRPKVASWWHPTKNGEITPSEVGSLSGLAFWWKCGQGHEWESRVVNTKTCPVCSNRTALSGVNDLASQFPDLAAQWHPTKNGETTPADVVAGGERVVWWQCALGHDWEANIYNRTVKEQGCPTCCNNRVLIGFNDLATVEPALAAQWHPTKNGDLTAQSVTRASGYKAWWQCAAGHEWMMTVVDRTGRQRGCLDCSRSTHTSRAENEIKDFLESLGVEVDQSNRRLIKPAEVDLYLPQHNIAIEYNGLRWHSETYRDRNYHLSKHLALEDAGIRLIHIWEDDWRDRPDIIKRMLATKIGVAATLGQELPDLAESVRKIGARSTTVVELPVEEARTFLEANHIQGFVSGRHYLGLRDKQGVVRAVLTLRQEANGVLNIVRYATYGNVQGGFTKLLRYAITAYSPSAFITFADRTVSDGGLYESTGFVVDRVLDPDYMYVVDRVRKHKFGYRLKRFRNDPELQWEDGLTERELADLNGLVRIWDAGKVRYRLDVE